MGVPKNILVLFWGCVRGSRWAVFLSLLLARSMTAQLVARSDVSYLSLINRIINLYNDIEERIEGILRELDEETRRAYRDVLKATMEERVLEISIANLSELGMYRSAKNLFSVLIGTLNYILDKVRTDDTFNIDEVRWMFEAIRNYYVGRYLLNEVVIELFGGESHSEGSETGGTSQEKVHKMIQDARNAFCMASEILRKLGYKAYLTYCEKYLEKLRNLENSLLKSQNRDPHKVEVPVEFFYILTIPTRYKNIGTLRDEHNNDSNRGYSMLIRNIIQSEHIEEILIRDGIKFVIRPNLEFPNTVQNLSSRLAQFTVNNDEIFEIRGNLKIGFIRFKNSMMGSLYIILRSDLLLVDLYTQIHHIIYTLTSNFCEVEIEIASGNSPLREYKGTMKSCVIEFISNFLREQSLEISKKDADFYLVVNVFRNPRELDPLDIGILTFDIKENVEPPLFWTDEPIESINNMTNSITKYYKNYCLFCSSDPEYETFYLVGLLLFVLAVASMSKGLYLRIRNYISVGAGGRISINELQNYEFYISSLLNLIKNPPIIYAFARDDYGQIIRSINIQNILYILQDAKNIVARKIDEIRERYRENIQTILSILGIFVTIILGLDKILPLFIENENLIQYIELAFILALLIILVLIFNKFGTPNNKPSTLTTKNLRRENR